MIGIMAAGRTATAPDGQDQLTARAVVRRDSGFHRSAAEVQIRLARLTDYQAEECEIALSWAERERAAKYVIPWVRHQFVVGRYLLRLELAQSICTEPKEIELTTREDGKPVLADPTIGLHFNVSHSGGWAAIAMARRPVGVDLEAVREIPNERDLVERFFAPNECLQYRSLPDVMKRMGFLRGWTCKEAVLKAVGSGMREVDACAVCLDPTQPPCVIHFTGRPAGERWGLATWNPAADLVAAVAIEGYERIELSES
jgi:4'-phosphopantetheinyl transferase